jgi:single-stranded-DNA-specific exonuclease
LDILWRSREEAHLNLKDSLKGNLSDSEYPPLIRKLLMIRGLSDSDQVLKWLSPKLSELKDPFSLLNMQKGIDRLVEAYKKQETICIYADFDLDGTSGLALLQDGFKQLGFEHLVLAQPKRLSQGYGFHAHLLDDLKKQNVSLIVTVDVGITAFEACLKATELGMDVILTDHHQPAKELPKAFAVINPNQKEDTSGLGYLAGAGVAFYLLRALKRGLVDAGLVSESRLDLKSVLDCFCIATLTDMVPLVDDNRALVKQGLLQLEKTTRPGLRALLQNLDMAGRPLSSQDVAIRFAPKLNALSRMETGVMPIDLYLAEDSEKAEEMVKTVLKNNSTRVQLQGAGESEAFEKLESWPHEGFVFLASQNFHKGVVGLIATKLCLQKNVPAFVGAINEEGVITGSARLPNGFASSLLKALEAGKDHLVRFGGHEAAAGFELHSENETQFVAKLIEHFKLQKTQEPFAIEYDLQAELHEINENLMRWFEIIGPFGQSFSNPILRIRNVHIKDVITLKGNHLKFKFEDESTGRLMDGIYFSPPKQLVETLPGPGQSVDLLGELQWNYFSGRRTLQILIKDMKPNDVLQGDLK